jgi:hypothetical protein
VQIAAMTDMTITCPNCAAEIRVTDSLAAPLIAQTRRDFETRLAAERAAIAVRETAVVDAETRLAAEVEARVGALRQTLADDAARAAGAEMEALRAALRERGEKLAAAQAVQAEALRKGRELDDAKRELELSIETRVAGALGSEREKARTQAEEAMRLKVAEKEQVISSMQAQIEALRRRAEQGSQQLQGEVMELDLEAVLRARFPADQVQPVPKGVTGADLIQRVFGPGAVPAGMILWETKRTRTWTEGWLAKLRDDQRALGAEVALLMTEALPKGVESFDLMDGVWVARPAVALPLAMALRQSLIELGQARAARDGQGTKMELVYDYLTSPRFRHRVGAVIERVRDMSEDLDRERKAMTRLWAKREMQIHGVIGATVGMYGDLQGIAGKAFQEIEGREGPLLDAPGEE